MGINQISFGNIVKVNAPRTVVTQIKEIANLGTRNRKLNKDVQNLFPDIKEGEAEVFYYDANKTSFIFSGKDAKKYLEQIYKDFHETANMYVRTNSDSNDKDKALETTSAVAAEHRENVMKLINGYNGVIKTIDPIFDSKYKLKSLNIII